MSTIKTVVEKSKVLDFLQNTYDKEIPSVELLQGGEQSQAFSFFSKGKELVIRVNKKDYSYRKDDYAYKHFQNPKIPMPKIIKVGKFDESLYFAISERVEGENFDTLPLENQKKLTPQLIEIHDAIRTTKIEGGGYGYWDKQGIAKHKSWKEFILDYKDEIYPNWEHLYKNTLLERKIIDDTYERIGDLIKFLPEERFLVHADFGGNNTVSDGTKITGILDWGESTYGDFLYDVAWVEFYSEKLNFSKACRAHYKKIKLNIPNFDERILCYMLRIGVIGLGFFAISDQKENYIWQKGRIEKLLSI